MGIRGRHLHDVVEEVPHAVVSAQIVQADGFIRRIPQTKPHRTGNTARRRCSRGRNITKKPWQAASTSAAACMAKGIPTLKTASRRPEPTPRRIADGIGLHERIRHRLALPIGRSSSDTASLLIAKWAEQKDPLLPAWRLGFSALARHPFPGTTHNIQECRHGPCGPGPL